ncbi:alpha-amylase family glycosyl hydrolase [Blastococcus xanthinilyticus]|uniref:Glycosidase n=1 Tax=Blastococcus xanthinilyticus TaxID=1564164 RepID=A0A5S5D2D1_9ACTN|nr:alpha-amylase family glycosyl hydrolase [Blastococcus xanthinilyticus]TYP88962.1 glycosidase [Blastococcus xanthinilyticus]
MTAWPDTVMWWHVYPLGFTGAPIRPADAGSGAGAAHRLGRVEAWLDHVVELGLNGLALGPVFAAQTHGYDTVDHFRVDPRLGDEDDLGRLFTAARDRGIRVLLDGVFNHVGRGHPAFAQLEAEGPAAGTADLFRVDWSGWRPGDPVRAEVFEGHEQLVALDHGSPAVADLVVRVLRHWLDRGADGWRLDAAYAVPPAFWAQVLPQVRSTHPDAWFTGEVIHGDAPAIVRASTMDSLTQYELWQGVWHGIAERNFFELAHALERHNGLLATFVPSTFLGNHDVTRIASAVGTELLPHALAVLFTVAGVPSVYAGDEYAYTAVKEERAGGDDAVRPEFPPRPPAPAAGEATAAEFLRVHRELIALRRRNPWLVRAHTDVVQLANEHVVLRSGTAGAAVVVALNLADAPVTVPAADARAVACGTGRLASDRVELPPRGWAVLEG